MSKNINRNDTLRPFWHITKQAQRFNWKACDLPTLCGKAVRHRRDPLQQKTEVDSKSDYFLATSYLWGQWPNISKSKHGKMVDKTTQHMTDFFSPVECWSNLIVSDWILCHSIKFNQICWAIDHVPWQFVYKTINCSLWEICPNNYM